LAVGPAPPGAAAGALLAVGLAPPGAAAVAATMTVASSVHVDKGFFSTAKVW